MTEAPDYAYLATNRSALIDHAALLADGHAVSGMKGNALDMEVANILQLLIDELEKPSANRT